MVAHGVELVNKHYTCTQSTVPTYIFVYVYQGFIQEFLLGGGGLFNPLGVTFMASVKIVSVKF